MALFFCMWVMDEINTGGGTGIGGDVETGGGNFAGRDSQKNVTNISVENNEHLQIIREQLNRLAENIEFRFYKLENSLDSRLKFVERDIASIQRKIEQMDDKINEQEKNSILVKWAQPTQPTQPTQPFQNGNLKRIFWALIGLSFILSIGLTLLAIYIFRGHL